jgi:hypothetical protein
LLLLPLLLSLLRALPLGTSGRGGWLGGGGISLSLFARGPEETRLAASAAAAVETKPRTAGKGATGAPDDHDAGAAQDGQGGELTVMAEQRQSVDGPPSACARA